MAVMPAHRKRPVSRDGSPRHLRQPPRCVKGRHPRCHRFDRDRASPCDRSSEAHCKRIQELRPGRLEPRRPARRRQQLQPHLPRTHPWRAGSTGSGRRGPCRRRPSDLQPHNGRRGLDRMLRCRQCCRWKDGPVPSCWSRGTGGHRELGSLSGQARWCRRQILLRHR